MSSDQRGWGVRLTAKGRTPGLDVRSWSWKKAPSAIRGRCIRCDISIELSSEVGKMYYAGLIEFICPRCHSERKSLEPRR